MSTTTTKVGRPRKFTREEAREIRRLRNTDKVTFKDLCARFGVSIPTLRHIVQGTGSYENTL